jgi:hypothetical protein
MPGLLAIGPEVLERFPVPVAPVVIFSASVILMGALYFDYLEVFLQVFNEALKEFLESLRFSQVEPGCIRGADSFSTVELESPGIPDLCPWGKPFRK